MAPKGSTLRRTAAGDPLTDKVVDALADEAEVGYDLTSARPRCIGRPSLGDEGSSPRIAFRVDSKTYAAVRAAAVTSSRPISSVAREALKLYLARSL